MDTIAKILIGGAAVFFIFGGPRLVKRGGGSPPATVPPVSDGRQPAGGDVILPRPDQPAPVPLPSGDAGFAISSMDWLRNNGNFVVEMQVANLTYYLIAKSERCHIDSLKPCLRDAVLSRGIDPVDFQYTYFFDRVLRTGRGQLVWGGNTYVLTYDRLRQSPWNTVTRNNYTCSGFSFTSKSAVQFINNHIGDETLFVPIEKSPFPNGATISGQPAYDWRSLAVNPGDFPISVPDQRRRERLTNRFVSAGQRPPAARSFVVIQTRDNRLFLTEASDSGSGVKPNWIDWRISNTDRDIATFLAFGPTAKAYCFTFDDPTMTFERVLASSGVLTQKR